MSAHDLLNSLMSSQPGQLLGPIGGANASTQQMLPGGQAPPPLLPPAPPQQVPTGISTPPPDGIQSQPVFGGDGRGEPPPFNDTPPDIGLPLTPSIPGGNPPGTPGSLENPLGGPGTAGNPIQTAPAFTGATVTPDAPIIRDAAGNVIQGRVSDTQQNLTIPGAQTGGFTSQESFNSSPLGGGPDFDRARANDTLFQQNDNSGGLSPFELLLSGQDAPTSSVTPPPPPGGDQFGGGNPDLPGPTGEDVPPGPPHVEPPGGSAGPGTDTSPATGFNINTGDPNKDQFINSLLSALMPLLASGEFSNFFQQEGATGNQNQQNATNAFDQLSGGDPFRDLLRNSGGSALADPLGNQTPGIQGFLEQQLRAQIEGGGISDQFVGAARERILGPAQEALAGRNNQQGGGVADPDSGLFQELQRRQEQDFLNDLILFGGSNVQNSLGQAGQLGAQQFGQGLQNRQFGAGAQGQLFSQDFGVGQAQAQLGQGQQGLDLQNQGQRNQFGLGQSAIGSDILQTMLAGREGGGLGSFLASLLGNSGNISELIKLFGGMFGNPDTGEGTNPTGGDKPNGGDPGDEPGERDNICDDFPQFCEILDPCAIWPDLGGCDPGDGGVGPDDPTGQCNPRLEDCSRSDPNCFINGTC